MKDIFDKMQSIVGISKYSSSEIPTPLNVVTDMNNLLIENDPSLLNPNTKFLDIAVKSGRFLVDLFDRLMNSESLIEKFPNEEKRRQHIIDNQLYGLATSPIVASAVRKQLYNDAIKTGNIRYIKNVPTKESIKEEFGIMNFDVVIGNPPYNNDTYLDFVTLGHRLSTKYTCMITPAKWQAKTDGKPKNSKNPTPDKNEEFRKNIVPYMSKIVFYPCTEDIFDIREVSGISYYLIEHIKCKDKQIKIVCNRNKVISSEFETHDETTISLCNRQVLSVIGKVGTLGEGFKQSLYVKNTDHGEITIDGTLGFKRQTFIGEQDRGEALKQAGYVEVMQGEKVVGYKATKDLFTMSKIDKYKITTSVMAGNVYLDDIGRTYAIVPCNILGPYQVPKGSYPVLRYFDTMKECESFKSYYMTKLVAFLFYFGACGSTLTKEFFRFIPDPKDWTLIYEDTPLSGYTPDENGIYTDNDGNKHCSLYAKYNLTPEEINLIESVIKDRK